MRSGTKAAFSLAGLFFLLLLSLRYFLPFALPFLLGTGLALAAEPLVKFLCGPVRLPRGAGAGIGVSAACLLLTGLILSLLSLVLSQLRAAARILPQAEAALCSGIRLLEDRLLFLAAQAPGSLAPFLRQTVRELFSGGAQLLRRAAACLLTLAGGFLTHIPDRALTLGTAVISGYMISAKLPRLRAFFRKLTDSPRLRALTDLLGRIRSAVGQWLVAQLKLAGVTFLLLTGGLILLAVPCAPLWALGITAMDALPVLGTGSVLLPWALAAWLQGNPVRALGLLGTYLTVALTRTVLEPRVVGKQLGLDPLLTLAALYCGYRLWGLAGMILSPMLAVIALQLLPRQPE